MPIFRAIFGLITYITSVCSLSFIFLMIYQVIYYAAEREWVWIWEYNDKYLMILVVVVFFLSNYIIEDECKKECEEHKL